MAESSFQIIHKWANTPNYQIAISVKRVFDNYYKEVDQKECESYIVIKYNHQSNDSKYIAGFDFVADLDSYDLYDTQSFYKSLKDALIETGDVLSVIILNNESRLEEYTLYYQQIAHMEMRLREIITFILADCLNGGYYKLLESQKPIPIMKGINLIDKESALKERGENELFYLTFNHYKQIVVPDYISATHLKELVTELTTDEIKEGLLKLRIFNTENYRDFLASIQEDLTSLEQFRNCVAHNRKYTDEEWGNYDKAYSNLDKSLKGFWETLLMDTEDKEFSYFEDEAFSELSNIMKSALWHTKKKQVHIPRDIDEEHYYYDKIKNYDELLEYLSDKAYDIGINYFPSDKEFREIAEKDFNGFKVAKKILQNYQTQLSKLKW